MLDRAGYLCAVVMEDITERIYTWALICAALMIFILLGILLDMRSENHDSIEAKDIQISQLKGSMNNCEKVLTEKPRLCEKGMKLYFWRKR